MHRMEGITKSECLKVNAPYLMLVLAQSCGGILELHKSSSRGNTIEIDYEVTSCILKLCGVLRRAEQHRYGSDMPHVKSQEDLRT